MFVVQVTHVPQLRFAVTTKTKAASLYMTLFQQFPQIRGYSARLFGLSLKPMRVCVAVSPSQALRARVSPPF